MRLHTCSIIKCNVYRGIAVCKRLSLGVKPFTPGLRVYCKQLFLAFTGRRTKREPLQLTNRALVKTVWACKAEMAPTIAPRRTSNRF